MSFLEHRLLSQRSPDAPRGVELPSGEELRSLADRISKRASEMIQDMLSPQNRREFNRVVEELSKNFIQAKDDVFAAIGREIPNLKNYFRLGGSFGAESGTYQLEEQMNRLRALNGDRSVSVPPRGKGFLSALFGNDDGSSDVLELYGEDAYPFSPEIGGGFRIDIDGGMQSLLAETRRENDRLSAERTRVFTDSLSKLEALRKEVEQDERGGEPRSNLQPLSGETRDQQRARLEKSLADAQKAFSDQRTLVEQLVADASTPAERLKTERARLVELEQQVIGFEGQITALRGERVDDNPQPQ